MADAWRQFATDEPGNRSDIPEGGYPGARVNNDIRDTRAAVRKLGDETPKIDTTKGMSGESKIGTAALRDDDYFLRSGGAGGGGGGGTPGQFGIVPIGAIVPFFGTLAAAEALLPGGYAVCDGRRVVNPSTRLQQDMPDLRDAYVRFFGNSVSPGALGGSAVGSASGTVSISGTTGGGSGNTGATALTGAQSPALLSVAVTAADGPGSLLIADAQTYPNGTPRRLNAVVGAGESHTHTLTGHTHAFSGSTNLNVTVPVQPPYRALVPVMRIA